MNNTDNKKETKSISSLVNLIMKAVALAMGVGVVVLSAMSQLEVSTGMTLLGLGLACLAIPSLANK